MMLRSIYQNTSLFWLLFVSCATLHFNNLFIILSYWNWKFKEFWGDFFLAKADFALRGTFISPLINAKSKLPIKQKKRNKYSFIIVFKLSATHYCPIHVPFAQRNGEEKMRVFLKLENRTVSGNIVIHSLYSCRALMSSLLSIWKTKNRENKTQYYQRN